MSGTNQPYTPHSVDEYATALANLAPPGAIWRKDPNSIWYKLYRMYARSLMRVATRAYNLLIDAFPSTAVELLPEWEQTLGLPNPCMGMPDTLQARQAYVAASIGAQGGQTIADIRSVLETAGVPVSRIIEFRHDDPEGAHHLVVELTSATAPIPFRAGRSRAGDRLVTINAAMASCWLDIILPAQTTYSIAIAD